MLLRRAHLAKEDDIIIIILIVQHQLLCDRFGLLHRGRLVSEGTLAELQERTGCRGLAEMFLKLSQTGPALALEAV